ncbi:MAG: beta strand repeat-containing protein [Flavobacteriales bacterium]
MKNSTSIKCALLMSGFMLLSAMMLAQIPQGFNYQAAIRNVDGEVAANTSATMRMSIHQNTFDGTIVYQETHGTTTNQFGLVNLIIGEGTPDQSTFDAVQWNAATSFFMQVEVDLGDGFVDIGTQQLMSVPFAMAAKKVTDVLLDEITDVNTAGATSGQVLEWNGTEWTPAIDNNTTYTAGSGISISGTTISNAGDVSNTNEIQALTLSGSNLTLSNGGGSVTLPTGTTYTEGAGIDIVGNAISANDASATNEIQALTLSGSNLTLSNGGGSVTLPTGTTYTEGAGIDIVGNAISANDASATNEIQALSISGANISLSNGGGSVTVPDASATNEIQALTLSGNNLTLSNGGGTVTLPTGTTYTAGTGISIAGNAITNTGDTDASNDITNITPHAGDVTGFYNNLQIAANAVGAAEIANDAVGATEIASGAIGATELASMGATAGQILEWDGLSWSPQTPASTADGVWSSNATNAWRLGGNIGLGTSTPVYGLHMHNKQGLHLTTTATGTTFLDGFYLGQEDPSTVTLVNFENGPMTFHTNFAERMRIGADGNIGIGTQFPVAPLHLANTAANTEMFLKYSVWTTGHTATDGSQIGLNASGHLVIEQKENLDIQLKRNGSTKATVNSTGVDVNGELTSDDVTTGTVTAVSSDVTSANAFITTTENLYINSATGTGNRPLYATAAGQVYADNLSASTQYMNVMGIAFHHFDECTDNFVVFEEWDVDHPGIGSDGDCGKAYCAINLPQGAVVTKLTARFKDDADGQYFALRLRKYSISDETSWTNLATVYSATSDDYVAASTTTITSPTINNNGYAYTLVLAPDTDDIPTTGWMYMLSATIEYYIP